MLYPIRVMTTYKYSQESSNKVDLSMTELRKMQLFQLQMLKDIADVCENNNIKYSLSDGTLIGAVRHNGYIPWDDDIDLMMELSEYKKFISIAPEQLGNKYFLQTYKTDKEFFFPWAKIRATTSMPLKDMNWNIHFGICIDIFPVFGIERDNKERVDSYLMFNRMLLMDKYLNATNTPFTKKQRLLYAIPYGIRRMLYSFVESKYSKDPQKYDFCFQSWGVRCLFPTSLFEEYTSIKFEDRNFMVIKGYDEYLRIQYGDYMKLPPESEQMGHELKSGEIIWDSNRSYLEYKKEYLNDMQTNR